MFCKFCGAQLPDNAKFCGNCGNQLGQPSAAQAPNATSENAANSTPVSPASNPVKKEVPYNNIPAGNPGKKIKVKKKYNLGNLILWVGCLLGIVSLFTTYATASLFGISESVSLIDTDDGIIFLIIIAIVAVIGLFKLNSACIVGSVFTIFFINLEYRNVADSYYSGMVEFGAGNTMLWLGGILMLIGSVAALILAINQKKKDRQAAMASQVY